MFKKVRSVCFFVLALLSSSIFAVEANTPLASKQTADKGTELTLTNKGNSGELDAARNDERLPIEPPAKLSAHSKSPVSSIVSPEVSSLSNWTMVILTLMGMVLLILGLAWIAKRFGGLNAMGMRDMRVVSAIPVGTREKVALVDVKGQQFLIGVTAHNISHLHTFSEAVVSTSPTSKQGDFVQKLQAVMGGKTESPQAAPRHTRGNDQKNTDRENGEASHDCS